MSSDTIQCAFKFNVFSPEPHSLFLRSTSPNSPVRFSHSHLYFAFRLLSKLKLFTYTPSRAHIPAFLVCRCHDKGVHALPEAGRT